MGETKMAKKQTRKAARAPSRAPKMTAATARPLASIAIPGRKIPLTLVDSASTSSFQRAAMQWSYIVRNRHRWSGRESLIEQQAKRAQDLLQQQFGISQEDLGAIAGAAVAQVMIPYERESTGWEARVFPWEFVLSAATRNLRKKSLTVLRGLERRGARRQGTAAPKSVLYVESAPGKLGQDYSFASERALLEATFNTTTLEWHEIRNPTREQLRREIARLKPGLVHLAGFDTHQGMRYLEPDEREPESGEASTPRRDDGYILITEAGRPDPVSAEGLAQIVCAGSARPILVSCSMWNSASRICPMLIAHGAGAAIGFQDSFDDELAEAFFSTFYRNWCHAKWNLSDAFVVAWDDVRARSPGVAGTGVVVWSENLLVKTHSAVQVEAATARIHQSVERASAKVLDPLKVNVDEVVNLTIKPVDELNYSLLHNRRPLFEDFKIVKRVPGQMLNVGVTVDLNAGGMSFPFRKNCVVKGPELDLKTDIHASLTAELARSLRESVNTSLFVEITWGPHVLRRETHRVRLLPPDQWRDNDTDRLWLPCFVLPRDPAVGALIEKAHRYVRVLRDDPNAGFEGYQCIDPDREDPTEDVDLQVQAIWSAIVHEWQLGYVNPPPTYSRELDSQRLRTPSAILRDRSGTCIDLALLFASCLELVDIYPVIFLLEGHAYPGYWRSDTAHEAFLNVKEAGADIPADARSTAVTGTEAPSWVSGKLAYDEIVRQVNNGGLVPIESVKLTENCGFWEAVEAGRENFKPKRDFHSMLDLVSARFKGVTPLPISETSL
jgi:hypothetical protein